MMNETTTPAAPAKAEPSAPAIPVRLTERAVTQVKEVIKNQKWEGYFFVVRVVPEGCNGLGYSMDLAKDSRPGDIVWEQDGVKLATDPMSNKYLSGTELDYVSTVQGSRFVFANPNAKSSCGCGTSFST
jgi:iron-sulfur cluster assembly protein